MSNAPGGIERGEADDLAVYGLLPVGPALAPDCLFAREVHPGATTGTGPGNSGHGRLPAM